MHLFIAQFIDTVTQGIIPDGGVLVDDNGIIQSINTANFFEINHPELFLEAKKYTGIIVPGFVNVHCHIELSHLKNKIPQGGGLNLFLANLEQHRKDDNETIISAAKEALFEMEREGIMAIGDICNSTIVANILSHTNLYIHHFSEAYAIDATKADAAFAKAKTTYDVFDGDSKSIVPHSPYSVSNLLMDKISEHNIKFQEITCIHNQETEGENEMYVSKTGETIERLQMWGLNLSSFNPTGKHALYNFLPKLAKAKHVLMVHNTFTTKEDTIWAMENFDNVFWCFCVRANLFIENKIPPIELFLACDDKICIGTDSLASNRSLSIIKEMKEIQDYLFEKGVKESSIILLQMLLKWATINGAKYLCIDKTMGSIEVGKRPGLCLLENIGENFLITNDTYIRRLI